MSTLGITGYHAASDLSVHCLSLIQHGRIQIIIIEVFKYRGDTMYNCSNPLEVATTLLP